MKIYYNTVKFLTIIAIATTVIFAPGSSFSRFEKYPAQGTVPDPADSRPDTGPFHFTPFAEPFSERQRLALEYTAERRGKGSLESEIARAVLGLPPNALSEETLSYIETRFAGREDCTDFTAARTILTLYVNKFYPFLPEDQFLRLKRVILDFKYWLDEPGYNTMIFWTENHQMVFHSTEFLAGQMFPDEVFTNNGKTGAWHMDHARKLILQWMDRRARWGFSEWDSNVYYDEDLIGVLMLAEFSEDRQVEAAAALVADIMLLDICEDLFKGIYGTSHGRTYAQDVLSGWDYAVSQIISVLTGLGPFRGASSMSALPLALARRYKPSGVIIRLGQDTSEEFTGYERHGIPLEKIREYGISRTKLEDAPTLWSMGAHSQPAVVDLFLKAADTYDLWKHPFIEDAAAAKNLPRDGSVGRMRKFMEIESDRTLLGEVNKITYRTREYMLSSAQSYRPGERGNQHHIWQATLSPNALVFTTNPGSLEIEDRTPCYWGGQNRFPRVGQYKNVAFILYNIDMRKAVGERNVFDFTHAFFPKWAFNEVVEKNGWIFGRAGDGYIALRSSQPYSWQEPAGEFVHDAIAQGVRNIWLCRMGGKSRDGDFKTFTDRILDAEIHEDIGKLEIGFHDPELGEMEFSWNGPLRVNGKEIPLDGYKRVENPWCVSEFNSGVYTIEYGGERLILDFPNLSRRTEKIQ